MNNVIYDRIGRVLFQKDNIGSNCRYVNEFEDCYDTIVLTTNMEIDFVERGWLGDITYWATGGWNVNDLNAKDLTSEPVCVKGALCIRVEVRSEQGYPVEWTYTFLKY